MGQLLKDRKEKAQGYSHTKFSRILSFFFFTAISVSVAFIPLFTGKLITEDLLENIDFFLALPISTEMLLFGVATIGAGFLVRKTGWKFLFIAGGLITTGGIFLSAISKTMSIYILARSLSGLGSGVVFIALRSLINLEQKPKSVVMCTQIFMREWSRV